MTGEPDPLEAAFALASMGALPKSSLIDYDATGFGRCRFCSYIHQLPVKAGVVPVTRFDLPTNPFRREEWIFQPPPAALSP